MDNWFFNNIGKITVALIVLSIVSYVVAIYIIGSAVQDGVQHSSSIAHGIGGLWYQVQQGAKGK